MVLRVLITLGLVQPAGAGRLAPVMREAVIAFAAPGPFPSEQGLFGRRRGVVSQRLGPSLDRSKMKTLASGPKFLNDDCFGAAWSLLHLIETAPGWPLQDAIAQAHPCWAEALRKRWLRECLVKSAAAFDGPRQRARSLAARRKRTDMV